MRRMKNSCSTEPAQMLLMPFANRTSIGVSLAKMPPSTDMEVNYAKMDEESYYFIFLAKLLVGSYTVGKPDYRIPPPREPSNPASDLYDSCVNRIHNLTIFVVIDVDQYHPEYIIKFLKLDSSFASQVSSTKTVKLPPSSHSKFQNPTTTTGTHRTKSTYIRVSGQRLKAKKNWPLQLRIFNNNNNNHLKCLEILK